jgi:predicted RNase H-like nuclease (RuvC/YqgF family)
MQNCNKCSLNNDNIYNYTTFQSNYNKTNTDFIIEGLENKASTTDIKKTEDLNNENTLFNKLYAEYLTCSIPNTDLCKSILKQYNVQSDKVENLNQDKTAKGIKYTTCDNLKKRCEGVHMDINNTNLKINELNDIIYKMNQVLATCPGHKERCQGLETAIANKKKEIEDLEKIIQNEKSTFKKNLCNQ